jgi:hypothetical protein
MKPIRELHDLDQSLSLDNITRDLLSSRRLKHCIDKLMETVMTNKLARRVAIITGGSTGMGLATATAFYSRRHGPSVHYRPPQGRAGRSRR